MTNSLKELRKAKDLTLDQLARATGLGASTIGNFENGKTKVSKDTLKKIADSLKVSVDDILKPPSHGGDDILRDQISLTLPNASRLKVKLRFVPVVSWASAGAANDYGDLSGQIDQMVETISADQNAFALIVEGDSMMPRFEAGDIVIFEPNSEPRNGDIVVAKLREGDGVLFKKFRRTGREGKVIMLESLNPDYTNKEYSKESFLFIYPAVEFKARIRRFL